MIDYELTSEDLYVRSSTSKGTQIKYYKDGYWYKINKLGYENIAEYLCSIVLNNSDCNNFVSYELCRVNGKSACRSKNFLKPGQELVTFQSLHEQYFGTKLTDRIMEYRNVEERIKYTIDFMKKVTSLDLTKYLQTVLSFDMLTRNEDRHFDNLAVLYEIDKEKYEEAPIFDNGLALCSDYGCYPLEDDVQEMVDKVVALPFSGSFEQQAMAIGFGIKINYDTLLQQLHTLKKDDELSGNRAIDILEHQLERYKNVLCNRKNKSGEGLN